MRFFPSSLTLSISSPPSYFSLLFLFLLLLRPSSSVNIPTLADQESFFPPEGSEMKWDTQRVGSFGGLESIGLPSRASLSPLLLSLSFPSRYVLGFVLLCFVFFYRLLRLYRFPFASSPPTDWISPVLFRAWLVLRARTLLLLFGSGEPARGPPIGDCTHAHLAIALSKPNNKKTKRVGKTNVVEMRQTVTGQGC